MRDQENYEMRAGILASFSVQTRFRNHNQNVFSQPGIAPPPILVLLCHSILNSVQLLMRLH